MAIGNSGGSAASRFRPRGTALPSGVVRRNLLAEETSPEDTVGSDPDQTEAPEETVSVPRNTAPRATLGTRPARTSKPVVEEADTQSEATASDPESQQAAATDATQNQSPTSSTSIDPNPSSTTRNTSTRRGRPRRPSTRTAATQSSLETSDGTIAISVPAARARLREIEGEVKQMRAELAAELESVNRGYRERVTPLQEEYESLTHMLTRVTFEV